MTDSTSHKQRLKLPCLLLAELKGKVVHIVKPHTTVLQQLLA